MWLYKYRLNLSTLRDFAMLFIQNTTFPLKLWGVISHFGQSKISMIRTVFLANWILFDLCIRVLSYFDLSGRMIENCIYRPLVRWSGLRVCWCLENNLRKQVIQIAGMIFFVHGGLPALILGNSHTVPASCVRCCRRWMRPQMSEGWVQGLTVEFRQSAL